MTPGRRDSALRDALYYLYRQPLTPVQNRDKARQIRQTINRSLAEHYCAILEHSEEKASQWVADLVAASRADPRLDQGLREFFAFLIERQARMPEPVRDFVVEALAREPIVPRRKHGPSRGDRTARNIAIAGAVALIEDEYGFAATRNRASRDKNGANSACSIVTEALSMLGVNLSEDAVEKIWLDSRRKN
jgi:hypothetical protein